MRAPFITFEGGDGAGKSTQVERLARHLSDLGLGVVMTREPGGAPGAEKLRTLMVEGTVDSFSPLSEALVMYAARAEHLAHRINPARAAGSIVLCDRFADSSMAYQGVAGGVGEVRIAALDALVVGVDGPDLTLILDLPPDEAHARVSARAGLESRFEKKGAAYHAQVRAAFLAIAARAPQRCCVIDAGANPDAVNRRIIAATAPLIDAWRRQP